LIPNENQNIAREWLVRQALQEYNPLCWAQALPFTDFLFCIQEDVKVL
jgi:hypothetical protein